MNESLTKYMKNFELLKSVKTQASLEDEVAFLRTVYSVIEGRQERASF